MDIADLLIYTLENGASDLHLTVNLPPSVRIHGDVEPMNYPPMTRDQTRDLVYSIMNDRQRARFEEFNDIDFSLDFGARGRFRVNAFLGREGVGSVLRVIPSGIKSVEELGMPPIISKMAEFERGLVLVTGPTGSGKSTTLAALIDQINMTRRGHILTVEDPIEFVHPHKKCIVNQREVGPHTNSFSSALRAALREDPDVILVGEMRDLETISLAVSAAETGHLVFRTLHTSSAAQTIDRIIDVFPAHQQAQIRAQLAESIRGVVAQTLLKTASGKGRAAAVEVLVTTPAVRNLIREGKTFQLPSVIQTGVKEGMQTIEQSLSDLVLAGRVTQEEALIKAPDKEAFLTFLREGGTRPEEPQFKNVDINSSPPPMNIMGLGRFQR
ncbi:MAG: type IV pilus twitching motility protein PilT [Actinomycetota bacterium]